jgi:hypothetical protein
MKRCWVGWIAAATGLTVIACGGNTGTELGSDPTGGSTSGAAGGTTSSGGSPSGGDIAGGRGGAIGGAASGGTESGGKGGTGSGGNEPGGTESGGTSGTETGGATNGGTTTGGTETGGAGGAETGGAATGGTELGGAGGAETGGAATGGTPGIGGGGGMMGCFVGVQLDDCCSAPVAGDSLIAGSPCFVPYRDGYSSDIYESCPAAEECLMLNCVHPRPVSRVVSRDENGKCEFVDECDPSNIDCVVAIDYNVCCSCPAVTPSMVVAVDPCVVESTQPPPSGCADCSAVDCASCNSPAPLPACSRQGDPVLGICSEVIR